MIQYTLVNYNQLMTSSPNKTTMTFDNKLSLCIPRVVSEWANKDLIINKFKSLNVGNINRVDLVEKNSANGVKYYMAFLHFESWEDNAATRNIQYRILNEDNNARLIYDEPWYWILLKNTNPISDEEAALQERVNELEKQVTNLINWNNYIVNQFNWFHYYLQVHDNQLAPLWCHATNNGMNPEGYPTWMENNEQGQTMTQISEQSNMIHNEESKNDSHDNSTNPCLISGTDSDDESNADSDDNSTIPDLVSGSDSDENTPPPHEEENNPPSILQNQLRRRYRRIINRDELVNLASVNLINAFNNENISNEENINNVDINSAEYNNLANWS